VLRLEPEFTTRSAYEDFIAHARSGLPGSATIAAAAGALADSAVKVLTHSDSSGGRQ